MFEVLDIQLRNLNSKSIFSKDLKFYCFQVLIWCRNIFCRCSCGLFAFDLSPLVLLLYEGAYLYVSMRYLLLHLPKFITRVFYLTNAFLNY